VDLLEVAGHIAIAAARHQLPPTQMRAAVDVQHLAGDLAPDLSHMDVVLISAAKRGTNYRAACCD
jgi:hypothetical protein